MIDDHGDRHEHEHEHEHEGAPGLGLDAQSKVFLELRQQNLDVLEMAAMVAGYAGDHGPMKPGDLKQAMKTIWEIYSEFSTWIDPQEEGDEDEEGGE